jgi:hypothetical protein
MTLRDTPYVSFRSSFLIAITVVLIPLSYFVFFPALDQYYAFARCPNGTHKSPSGVCEQVVPHEGMPRCPNGFHRSPSGICEAVNGNSNSETNQINNVAGNNITKTESSSSPLVGQFKTYNEQYGRFSIQVPKDWVVGSPSVKQDSDTVDFSPNNKNDILFIVVSMDNHETVSQYITLQGAALQLND